VFSNASLVEFGGKEVAKIGVLQSDGVTYKTFYTNYDVKTDSISSVIVPYQSSITSISIPWYAVYGTTYDYAIKADGTVDKEVYYNWNDMYQKYGFTSIDRLEDYCINYDGDEYYRTAYVNIKIDKLQPIPYRLNGTDYTQWQVFEYVMPYGANSLWIPDVYYNFYSIYTEECVEYGGSTDIVANYTWDEIYANHGYEWNTTVELRASCNGIDYSYNIPVHITLEPDPNSGGDDSGGDDTTYGYCVICDASIPGGYGGGLCENHSGYWCCEHGNWHSPDEYCTCGGSGDDDHGNSIQCWNCGDWVPPGGICGCGTTKGH
jgi:hypothetical protein